MELQKKLPKRHPVLLSLPEPNIKVYAKTYPWHVKIAIDSNLDFSKTVEIRKEFDLQFNIEKKLTAFFESKSELKKVISYHQNRKYVHHWYLSSESVKIFIENIPELDDIEKKRGISFDIKNDEDWDEVNPILEQLYQFNYHLLHCNNL